MALRDCKGNNSVLLEFYNDEELCQLWISERVDPIKVEKRLSEFFTANENLYKISEGCGDSFVA